jgi:molybdopterin converting factor small subunit
MQVTVHLSSSLRLRRFDESNLECPTGSTARQVIQLLEIPESAVGILVVNDQHARLDEALKEGDRVRLLPPIGGG